MVVNHYLSLGMLGLVQLFTVATATGHLPSGHRLHYFIQPVGAAVIVLGLMVLLIGPLNLSYPPSPYPDMGLLIHRRYPVFLSPDSPH